MDPRLDSIVRHSAIFAINAMRNGPKQMAYSRGQDNKDVERNKIKNLTVSLRKENFIQTGNIKKKNTHCDFGKTQPIFF